MSYGSDITESLPYPLSNARGEEYSNSSEIYDIAIGGQPFFLGITDQTPYRRVTAKYRKDQLDTTREPGEQSLTGWWLRSQSSFHMGAGIKYFEPLQDETLRFRFNDSRGVDVWTQGQVKLLPKMNTYAPEGYLPQFVDVMNSGSPIVLTACSAENDTVPTKILPGYVNVEGNDGEQVTWGEPYELPTSGEIYSITNNGASFFYVSDEWKVFKGNAPTFISLYTSSPTKFGGYSKIAYVKQRLIYVTGNSIYELNPNANGTEPFPEPIYSLFDGNNSWVWTSIVEGPQAIYLTGTDGGSSSIYKITLNTSQTNSLGFPELNVPTVIADMPPGEIIRDFNIYLGLYAVIVTSRGVRVGLLSDNGDISYGPLLFENNDCSSVTFSDRFAFVSTRIDNVPSLMKIDLSTPTSTSSYVFAYARDVEVETNSINSYIAKQVVTANDIIGWPFSYDVNNIYNKPQPVFLYEENNPLGITTSYIAIPSKTTYVNSGYLKTGYIRYNMLDGKIFKYIFPRVNVSRGGLNVYSVDAKGNEFSLASFPQGATVDEVNVTFPAGQQEYLAFKFELTPEIVDNLNVDSPLMTGYQVKSLPAVPRQRMIQYPVFIYDHEQDALNNQVGYEGWAWERLTILENIESVGDTVRVQDFRTGESFIALIEELDFMNMTPTDKRYTGFGGTLLITVRKVS